MTDTETFTSDKTGKKYRFVEMQKVNKYMPPQGYLKEIIEPVLEVGDWYNIDSHVKAFIFRDDEGDQKWKQESRHYISEIRKATGEIWIKENGEWKKK